MATTRNLILLATLVLSGCSSSSPAASPAVDSGTDAIETVDSGSVDTGAVDTGRADTGIADSGAPEAEAGTPYPAGPYGVDVGSVLDPTVTWQGYLPNATMPSTIKMSDLYDADGSKGINAIVFDNAGQWCVACQYVAAYIPGWMSASGGNWSALGVAFVTLVIQTNNYEPATVATAKQWRDMFNLANTYVAADPLITFATASLPHTLLVDPRTMKVTVNLDNDAAYGAQAADPTVTSLATTNKK